MRGAPDRDPPARDLASQDPDAFRAHPLVQFTASEMPIRSALTFCEVDSEEVSRHHSGEILPWWSWFAGRPLVRRDAPMSWPRNTEGRPLHHVLQVDLEAEPRNLREAVFNRTGLPSGGLLQLFHDLETYGNADDADSGAWALRWIPKGPDDTVGDDTAGDDAEFVLQPLQDDYPRDGDDDGFEWVDAIGLNTAVVATVPPYLDLPQDWPEEKKARYVAVYEWLEAYSTELNVLGSYRDTDEGSSPWHDDFEPVDPPSRMGGFGFVEANPDYRAELEAGLPLATGDVHVLLIELNPAQFDTASPDWFHGLRPVQVWIRGSDLAAKNFTDVWCQIRTDA